MRNRRKLIAAILLSVFLAITFTKTANAEIQWFFPEELKKGGFNSIDPETRAAAKTFLRALNYCYLEVGTSNNNWQVDQALINGVWTDDPNMNGGIGYNFNNMETVTGLHFAYLRNTPDLDYDCDDSGSLIKDAFDFFADIGGTPKWDEWSEEDRIKLFCGETTEGKGVDHGTSGWARFIVRGVNTDGVDCVEYSKKAFQIGNPDNDYNFKPRTAPADGMDYLASFVNGVMKNKFNISNQWTNGELYFVVLDILKLFSTGSFSEIDPGTKNSYKMIMFDYSVNEKGNAEINKVTRYTTPQDNDLIKKLTKQLAAAVNEGTGVSDAQAEVKDFFINNCRSHYTDFYNKQKKYYNDMPADKKKEKADYEKWFKALPEKMEDEKIFVESSENPIYTCKAPEVVAEYMKTNPDPDSPDADAYDIHRAVDDLDVEGSDGKVEPNCYTSAGSFGWILCPVIDLGKGFLTDFYEDHIIPYLRMDALLFTYDPDGNGNPVEEGWKYFRDFANLAFIAIFIVVIFSQLTGVGIDNYGIKKILPKLVIAALFINLSYFICQLAVDIANIIGANIEGLFSGIGKVSSIALTETKGAPSGGAIVVTVLIVALISVITTKAILSTGAAVLVPVFLAIIGFVIAFVTLFVLLAVRKAMAVVLVMVSPCAFVCYMLPNTKKLFSRWLDMFKTVLLAYPICNVMIYGGQAVARIMLGINNSGAVTTNFSMALSAAAMCVAPIFFIPSVLKKSLGAIGGLVNAAKGRTSHFLKGRALDNKYARHLQQQGEQRKAAIQGEYNLKRANRTLSKIDPNKRMSATKRAKYQSALGLKAAETERQEKLHAASFKQKPGSSKNALINSFDAIGTKDADMGRTKAAIKDMAGSGQEEDMLNILYANLDDDKIKSMDAEQLSQLGDALMESGSLPAMLYGKQLKKGYKQGFKNWTTDASKEGFATSIQRNGASTISSMSDDSLKWIHGKSLGGAFTQEQMRDANGKLNTKQLEQYNQILNGRGDQAEIVSGMSDEQVANIHESTLANGFGTKTNDAAEGGAFVQAHNANAVEHLSSEGGAQSRAGMSNESMQAMGITPKAKIVSTDQYVDSFGNEHIIEAHEDGKFYRVNHNSITGKVTRTEISHAGMKQYKKK